MKWSLFPCRLKTEIHSMWTSISKMQSNATYVFISVRGVST